MVSSAVKNLEVSLSVAWIELIAWVLLIVVVAFGDVIDQPAEVGRFRSAFGGDFGEHR
jgi:hypothetical protein